MIRVADLLGSRRAPQFAAVAVISAGLAGCSADTSSRFAQDPFTSSPYTTQRDSTASVAPRYSAPQAAPYGRVESQPLPQYNRPATTSPDYSQYQRPEYNRPAQTAPQYSAAPISPPISAPRSYPTVEATGTSGGGRGMASYSPPSSPQIEPVRQAAPRSVAATSDTVADATGSAKGTTIIVGTGDTLDGIARRYKVSSAAILAANGYRGPRPLQPGQQLVIPRQAASASAPAAAPVLTVPAPKMAAAGGNVHHVNHGDTLYNIARRHQVPVAQLASANGLASDARLRVGSRITIPAASRQVAAAAPVPVATLAAPVKPVEKPIVVAQAPVARPAVASNAAVAVQKANLASATATPEAIEPPSSAKAADATGALPTFRWPVRGRVIAGYGAKTNGKQNDGINLAVPEGTPVKAAEDGVVAYAGNELKGYGNLVLIRHSNGYVTAYAHASELKVKRGDKISRGQVIGKAGQSGDVNSPQLHFEIRKGSSPVDPLQFLNGA